MFANVKNMKCTGLKTVSYPDTRMIMWVMNLQLWLTMGEGSTFVNNGTIKIVESCESDTWFAVEGLFHRIVNGLTQT